MIYGLVHLRGFDTRSNLVVLLLTKTTQRWQQNLSNLRVAQCPWDPPPQQQQPQQTIGNATGLPSNIRAEPSPAAQASSLSHPTQNGANAGGPYIKQEPKYEPSPGNFPTAGGYGASGMTALAQQRATQILHQQFGAQANASIQAAGLHQQPARAPGPAGQRPQQVPLPVPGQQRPPVPQYSQQQQSGLSTAQTDGAGDDMSDLWFAHVALAQSDGEESRTWVDGLLRAHLDESVARADSGLMVPLAEQPHLRNKRRKVLRQHLAQLSLAEAPHSLADSTLPLQFDGGDDDDDDDEDDDEDKDDIKGKLRDDDEDAINSDLDDDEEEDRDDTNENGEGPVGETILCTYDKVQRVKNKWKCTLKDGILTTGGKEYVFHKANGEFEW